MRVERLVSPYSATYMNQAFHVPITVSSDLDGTAALWTTVLPTTAAALAYHLVLRPLWRKERLAYVEFSRVRAPKLTRYMPHTRFFRQARHELREAKSDIVRAAEETVSLLRDTARRHSEAEASRDGMCYFTNTSSRANQLGDGVTAARCSLAHFFLLLLVQAWLSSTPGMGQQSTAMTQSRG